MKAGPDQIRRQGQWSSADPEVLLLRLVQRSVASTLLRLQSVVGPAVDVVKTRVKTCQNSGFK